MRIDKVTLKKANKIASEYSRWMEPKELQSMYKKLEEIGIIVPAWSAYSGDSHEFELNGEVVENSLFVFQMYKSMDTNRIEINAYFS